MISCHVIMSECPAYVLGYKTSWYSQLPELHRLPEKGQIIIPVSLTSIAMRAIKLLAFYNN